MILFISWIIGIRAMIPAHPGNLLEELFRSRKHPHRRKVSKEDGDSLAPSSLTGKKDPFSNNWNVQKKLIYFGTSILVPFLR